MDNIYGNGQLMATISAMAETGRTAHTVMFFGEKGSGKRTIADYYTRLLLCESPEDGKPCGKCRSCMNSAAGIHPDVMRVQKSGKLGNYSVETARLVRKDAFVRPNNSSGRKVYIFEDCRSMDPRTQNTLLKIIEEPPDYAYFLFTTASKANFLPTVISRCVCFGTSVCSETEARECLAERGFSQQEINAAVSVFHGNIGMCIEYISDEGLRARVDLTKSLAESIIRKDEYSLNTACYSIGRERADVRSVLSMLDLLIRDAAVLGKDGSAKTVGCFRDGAQRLSAELTAWQAGRIHQHIETAWRAIESNISIPLALTAMCAEIIGTVA